MKNLFLIRHAKASHDMPFIRDIERPLTERGYQDAALVSSELKKEYPAAGLFISSPAIRAYSTALVFASAYQVKENTIRFDSRLYDSSVQDYLEVIREIPSTFASACIFGHNDVISETAFKLLHPHTAESLRTCGLIQIVSDAASWDKFSDGSCTCELQLYPSLFKIG